VEAKKACRDLSTKISLKNGASSESEHTPWE